MNLCYIGSIIQFNEIIVFLCIIFDKFNSLFNGVDIYFSFIVGSIQGIICKRLVILRMDKNKAAPCNRM